MLRMFGAAVAFAAVGVGAAYAESRAEVGRIEVIYANFQPLPNDAYVQLPNGEREALRPRVLFLHPGDQIVVNVEQLDVAYSLIGAEVPLHITKETSPVTIRDFPTAKPGLCTILACSLIERVRKMQWLPIVVRTGARGELNPVTASGTLGEGGQFLPSSAGRLTVVWAGGIGNASIDDGASTSSSEGFQTLVCPQAGTFALDVKGSDGGELHWRVQKTSEDIPAPPDFGTTPSTEDRLARALWLLEPGSGHTAWHLFAISELAELRASSESAELAWRAIIANRYLSP